MTPQWSGLKGCNATVYILDRGQIVCTMPGDAQAHAEIVVEGNELWIEVQGSFFHLKMPKGFGVYRK